MFLLLHEIIWNRLRIYFYAMGRWMIRIRGRCHLKVRTSTHLLAFLTLWPTYTLKLSISRSLSLPPSIPLLIPLIVHISSSLFIQYLSDTLPLSLLYPTQALTSLYFLSLTNTESPPSTYLCRALYTTFHSLRVLQDRIESVRSRPVPFRIESLEELDEAFLIDTKSVFDASGEQIDAQLSR